jgi:hypothetical protein
MSDQAYLPEEASVHANPEPDIEPGGTGEGTDDPRAEGPTEEVRRRAAALTHPLGPRARRMALSLSEL